MNNDTFDAIVVGAGPAGTTAALLLARKGFKIILLERGEFPGSKNMFGGAIFGRVLHDIIPEYWTKAPFERFISRKVISLLTKDSAVALDFHSAGFKKPPYNGFVVQRTFFDRWYAQEAVKAGAILLTQTVADDLIWEGDRVVGVVTRRKQGELRAKIVIAADGAVSLLAKKAGLRKEFTPHQFSLGVKEVIQLPPGAIEERLGLNGDEGMSNEFLGRMGDGLHGGALIYTNRDCLSLGVVAQAHSLKAQKATIYHALDQFKRHPAIAPLIAGGRFLEYSAHLIPEAGINMVPKLYTGGMMVTGDAAGLVLAGGVFLEGVNFAIAAGRAAAETAIQAFEKGSFDKGTLADYETRLKDTFVLQDINRFKTAIPMLLNERLYEVYPSFVCRTLENWFMVDGTGHPKLAGMVKRILGEDLGLWQMAKDGYQFGRAMLW